MKEIGFKIKDKDWVNSIFLMVLFMKETLSMTVFMEKESWHIKMETNMMVSFSTVWNMERHKLNTWMEINTQGNFFKILWLVMESFNLILVTCMKGNFHKAIHMVLANILMLVEITMKDNGFMARKKGTEFFRLMDKYMMANGQITWKWGSGITSFQMVTNIMVNLSMKKETERAHTSGKTVK